MIAGNKKRLVEKMENVISHLHSDLSGIRTGRATLSLLDRVMVNFYGQLTPIKQVGTLSVPESRLITIQPWDTNVISEIEKAIIASDLGVMPSNDGRIIRIPIPPLSEERRKDLIKSVKKIGEESKIAIRNIRRDSNEEIKKFTKEGKIGEDEQKKSQDEIQKITDQYIKMIDDILRKKESEILEV